MKYRVALVGNPNVGKTSLYNRLTHSFEHVGNWQGVTVSEARKVFARGGDEIELIDLPGLYSLTVYSPEESAARDCIYFGDCDLFVCVADAGALARNLCLTLQLLELGRPVLLDINMMDELHRAGKTLDSAELSRRLGVPVVCTSATEKKSAGVLGEEILNVLKRKKPVLSRLEYFGGLVPTEYERLASGAGKHKKWAAIKLAEGDEYIAERLGIDPEKAAAAAKGTDLAPEIAGRRFAYIDGILAGIVKDEGRRGRDITRILDTVALGRFTALPVFAAIMGLVFWLTFGAVGGTLAELLGTAITKFVYLPAVSALRGAGAADWVVRLIGEGAILGAAGVLRFLPQVALLFFFLAVLEDSGYIARLAFATDGLFGKIGLSGRSVFTLLMGFGCSATAVLTTRGEADDRVRKKTAVLAPFASCSARLPVYTAVAGAYFAGGRFLVVLGLYFLGGAAAIFWAALMEKFPRTRSGEGSFIMEVPPYRFPTFERVVQIIAHNVRNFLVRVGTMIFSLNLIVWILSNFSLVNGFSSGGDDSILATLGGLLSPLFAPLGFGNWRAVAALMGGVVAKEGVIAAIESMGGVESVFAGAYPQLSALSFLVFTLLYIPCVATLSALVKEVGAKWTALCAGMQLLTAYSASLVVYRVSLVAVSHPAAVISAGALVALCLVAAALIMHGRARGCHGCAGCGAKSR